MNIRRITVLALAMLGSAPAILASTAPAIAAPALTSPAVMIDSAVFVERMHKQDGGLVRSLELSNRFSRGDRVITVVTWYRLGGNGGFTVTNPLPRGVAYQGSARQDEDVSVDGGRNWGKLNTLRVGMRLATPEDVTHVRWHVPAAHAASGQGRIAYSAIVR